MFNTALTKLRKAAPGSITLEVMVLHFKARRYPRSKSVLGQFERGGLLNPEERFFEVWSEKVGTTPEAVKAAHRNVLRGVGRLKALNVALARKPARGRVRKKRLTAIRHRDNTPARAARVTAARGEGPDASNRRALHRNHRSDPLERGSEECTPGRYPSRRAS